MSHSNNNYYCFDFVAESTTPSHQHDQENTISGAQLSPLRPSVLQMRQKCRVINAELLENTENSDSDEELPSL